MVRNEQDIIEPFIRHTRRYVDAMIIMINESGDRTPEIVRLLSRELGGIIYTDAPGLEYAQSERMTAALAYCQTAYFADYVLLLDADEFIDIDGREALVAALNSIPVGGYGKVVWKNFIYGNSESSSLTDPPRDFDLIRAVENPIYHKALLRLDGRYWHDLVVTQGNHLVVAQNRDVPSSDLDSLSLSHFPVRSPEQLTAKAAIGWAAYLALDESKKDPRWAWHWAKYFAQVRQGQSFTPEQTAAESFEYGQENPPPFSSEGVISKLPPRNYERKYSTGAPAHSLSLIVDAWARSLEKPSVSIELKKPEIVEKHTAGRTSFDADWHWDRIFFDIPPFRYLSDKYRPVSVVDYGCGIGSYLQVFKRFSSSKVLGIDGIPASATVLSSEEYRQCDLGSVFEFTTTAEFAICVEVMEHLTDEQALQLARTISDNTRGMILFSAAEVGQPGHNHINCRDLSEWLSRWADLGWYPDLYETFGVRALSTLCWFRRNLVILTRSPQPEYYSQALVEIANKRFIWPPSQSLGVRNFAFHDPVTAPFTGYESCGFFVPNPAEALTGLPAVPSEETALRTFYNEEISSVVGWAEEQSAERQPYQVTLEAVINQLRMLAGMR
jgi:SAM-dependent methyltransferase